MGSGAIEPYRGKELRTAMPRGASALALAGAGVLALGAVAAGRAVLSALARRAPAKTEEVPASRAEPGHIETYSLYVREIIVWRR